MYRLSCLLSLLLVFLAGCADENSPWLKDSPIDHLLIETPVSLIASQGTYQEIRVKVTAIDFDALPVSGVQINMVVTGIECVLEQENIETDSIGRVVFNLSFTMPVTESLLNISHLELLATSQDCADSSIIELRGVNYIPHFHGICHSTGLTELQDGSIQTTFYVMATDHESVPVEGSHFEFRIIPSWRGAENFGEFRPSAISTDKYGLACTTFNSLGGFGYILIRMQIPDSNDIAPDEFLLDIPRPGILRLSHLIVQIDPSSILVENCDSTYQADIWIQALDDNYMPCKDIQINASSDYGTIAHVTDTDSSGMAHAGFYFLASTDIQEDQVEPFDITIGASVRGSEITGSAIIRMEPAW